MSDQGRYDLVIRGGTVYDGTGAPGVRADVAIAGDRVVAVGDIAERGAEEIEAAGLAVAPGFIDVHTHDDVAVLLDPEIPFKVMQGVTTAIIGNCGSSVWPLGPDVRRWSSDGGAGIEPWTGFDGYLARVDEVRPSLNVAALIGHGTLRWAAMGDAARAPSRDDLERMRAWVREGVESGTVGLSTGLIYEPGRYAETEELIALAGVLGPEGGPYVSHIRDEADGLLDAVAEAIRVGEEAGVPVQISHHKVRGRSNRGRVQDSLLLIEEARARGVDVLADQYPYDASSTSLSAVLVNGGFRPDGPGSMREITGEEAMVAASPGHPEWEGRTVAALAQEWAVEHHVAAERMVAEEGGALFVILFVMDEADVRSVLAHPTTMIGSDGVPAGMKPHPRLYGTFPRVLGRYVRDEHVLELPDAVFKMTGMPAARFGLVDRGELRPGAFADVVVFDPATVRDTATYDNPLRFPDGIAAVLVNGQIVARNGVHIHARSGRALRRGQG